MKVVVFNVKRKWFDKIRFGEKTHEYRLATPYWESRLRFADVAEFRLGYPANTDTDKIMAFEIACITKINGKNTDLAVDAEVFDIELGIRLG